MNTITIPACCGLPMILHNHPIPGTNTFAQVFRCPACTFGYVREMPYSTTRISALGDDGRAA